MIKQDAVNALGQQALVQPARVRDALKANDRLKLYLTLLQAADAHAAAPQRPLVDLGSEIAAAGIQARDDVAWLRGLPGEAALDGEQLRLPGLERLLHHLADDLATMARPVLDAAEAADATDADPLLAERVAAWRGRLAAPSGELLPRAQLGALTHGRRGHGDSLHLLVMDLHKALNRLAAGLQGEDIEGAHAWGLPPGDAGAADRARIAAFMQGLARTRHLKLDHPGLDTAATRDGERLLIQNDIGTNDAHVLVLQVEVLRITLTYSDLHKTRFGFFQRLLGATGAQWSDVSARTSPGLNDGAAYQVGTASWQAVDEPALCQSLQDIGARVVFLIDWNRARKRLQAFVDKDGAIGVLQEAARRECGHMAWLVAGGEQLVWAAMAAQPDGRFRLGDRLDVALGTTAAAEVLLEGLQLAADAQRRGQPPAWVVDELRLRLARRLQASQLGVDLLAEHAAWCHALAQALRDGLAHGVQGDAEAAAALAAKAKLWEREADELVVQARARAERHPAMAGQALLLAQADDIADAIEEACFVLSLVAEGRQAHWHRDVQHAIQALADAVLGAVQDHVRAVAIVGAGAGAAQGGAVGGADADEAIDVLWRIVQAERQCDELLRAARRALARETRDAVALALGNELAAALEAASDHLLAVGHALRRRMLGEAGGRA